MRLMVFLIRVKLDRAIAEGRCYEATRALALRVDQLTAVMLVVVTGVSAMVHVYSIGYMHGDPSIPCISSSCMPRSATTR